VPIKWEARWVPERHLPALEPPNVKAAGYSLYHLRYPGALVFKIQEKKNAIHSVTTGVFEETHVERLYK
jgi:hypothetical protein